jgi:serine/threonine-protein kinase
VTPERYQELMDLFDEACDLGPDEQHLLLRRVIAGDEEMGQRLARLLEHDKHDSDILPRGEGRQALASQPLEPEVPSDRGSMIGASAIPRSWLVGQQIGNWMVHEHLGSGGVGAVHRVEHVSDGRIGAIKFLKHVGFSDPNNLKRFRREFRAVAALDHPGCLRVFEEGEDETGHYYVMEYVSGGDLRRLMGGDTLQLIAVLAKVTEALAYIHGRGIVHRDLKPANVLLSPGDPPHHATQPKLADFGIAKLDGSSSVITGAGLVGSIDFLAPEQLLGEPIDQRTDLFALGCLIFILFGRRPPFVGDNYERMRARTESTAMSLHLVAPHAPRAMVALVASLLARDPEDRPKDATMVLDALRAMQREPSIPDW